MYAVWFFLFVAEGGVTRDAPTALALTKRESNVKERRGEEKRELHFSTSYRRDLYCSREKNTFRIWFGSERPNRFRRSASFYGTTSAV